MQFEGSHCLQTYLQPSTLDGVVIDLTLAIIITYPYEIEVVLSMVVHPHKCIISRQVKRTRLRSQCSQQYPCSNRTDLHITPLHRPLWPIKHNSKIISKLIGHRLKKSI